MSIMKKFPFLHNAMLAVLLSSGVARAQTATYNFDSPQWVPGAATPLLNMAPDISVGLPGFRASFTSGPAAGGFSIGSFIVNNPSFSGQNLTQGGLPPGDTLTITLNQPIKSVHLDFQQFAPGHFDFTSAAGTASATTATQAGSLDFHSATGFTQFTLAAFYIDNSSIPMGIDNLVMTVPEPSSLTLAGLGACTLLIRRRRNQ
jgi:hypothetical protein